MTYYRDFRTADARGCDRWSPHRGWQLHCTISPPTHRVPGGHVPPQITWNPPHVKPGVDVVDEVDVDVLLELDDVVEVVVVAIVLLVVLVLVVLLDGALLLVVVVLVVLVVGGLLVVLELLVVVEVVTIVVGARVVVVEVLLLVLVVGARVDVVVLDVVVVLTVLEVRVLLLELDVLVLVDAGSGCVVRVLVVVELGRGRNVEDVVLDTRRGGAGQAAGAAAFRATNRPGASRFTAPPSKSRQ